MAILSCPQIVRLKTFGHVDSQIVQRQFEFSSAPSERFSYYGAPVAFVPRRGRRLFAGSPGPPLSALGDSHSSEPPPSAGPAFSLSGGEPMHLAKHNTALGWAPLVGLSS